MGGESELLVGSHYFTPSEFRCGCGCGLGLESMQQRFLRLLFSARSVSAAPFVLTSSIRCAEHNAAVGGVESSAHLSGWAADITATNSRVRYQIVVAVQQAGFRRIGIGTRFIHVDCAPEKPDRLIWTY